MPTRSNLVSLNHPPPPFLFFTFLSPPRPPQWKRSHFLSPTQKRTHTTYIPTTQTDPSSCGPRPWAPARRYRSPWGQAPGCRCGRWSRRSCRRRRRSRRSGRGERTSTPSSRAGSTGTISCTPRRTAAPGTTGSTSDCRWNSWRHLLGRLFFLLRTMREGQLCLSMCVECMKYC